MFTKIYIGLIGFNGKFSMRILNGQLSLKKLSYINKKYEYILYYLKNAK